MPSELLLEPTLGTAGCGVPPVPGPAAHSPRLLTVLVLAPTEQTAAAPALFLTHVAAAVQVEDWDTPATRAPPPASAASAEPKQHRPAPPHPTAAAAHEDPRQRALLQRSISHRPSPASTQADFTIPPKSPSPSSPPPPPHHHAAPGAPRTNPAHHASSATAEDVTDPDTDPRSAFAANRQFSVPNPGHPATATVELSLPTSVALEMAPSPAPSPASSTHVLLATIPTPTLPGQGEWQLEDEAAHADFLGPLTRFELRFRVSGAPQPGGALPRHETQYCVPVDLQAPGSQVVFVLLPGSPAQPRRALPELHTALLATLLSPEVQLGEPAPAPPPLRIPSPPPKPTARGARAAADAEKKAKKVYKKSKATLALEAVAERLYPAVWIHGLFVDFVSARSGAAAVHGVADLRTFTDSIMAAFCPLLRAAASPDEAFRLFLSAWALLGQTLVIFASQRPTLTLPDLTWELLDLSLAHLDQLAFRSWCNHAREDSKHWHLGSPHLRRFVKAAFQNFFALAATTSLGESCSFRFLRMAVIASDTDAMPDVNTIQPPSATSFERSRLADQIPRVCARIRKGLPESKDEMWSPGDFKAADTAVREAVKAAREGQRMLEQGRVEIAAGVAELESSFAVAAQGSPAVRQSFAPIHAELVLAADHELTIEHTTGYLLSLRDNAGQARMQLESNPTICTLDRMFGDAQMVTEPRLHDRYLAAPISGLSLAKGFKDSTDPARASYNMPLAVAELDAGRLLVVDHRNSALRLVNEHGGCTTLLGRHGAGPRIDLNDIRLSQLNRPHDLVVVPGDGSILIADHSNHRICQISPDLRRMTHVAGHPALPALRDGAGPDARFNFPACIMWHQHTGTFLIADKFNHAIRQMRETNPGEWEVSTLARLPEGRDHTLVDGPVGRASVGQLGGLLALPDGSVLFSEIDTHTVRRLYFRGAHAERIVTVLGMPFKTGLEDGSAADALFRLPTGMALDHDGSILLVDTGNACLRRIELSDDQKGKSTVTTLEVTSHTDDSAVTLAGARSIERCRDGSFVIPVGERNQLVRLMTPAGMRAARDTYLEIFTPMHQAMADMQVVVGDLARHVAETGEALDRGRAAALGTWRMVCEESFWREFERALHTPNLRADLVHAAIVAAPSLPTVSRVLEERSWPEDFENRLLRALVARMRRYSPVEPGRAQMQQDLAIFLGWIAEFPALAEPENCARVLRFYSDAPSLQFLQFVAAGLDNIGQVAVAMEDFGKWARDAVLPLQKAVSSWLDKQVAAWVEAQSRRLDSARHADDSNANSGPRGALVRALSIPGAAATAAEGPALSSTTPSSTPSSKKVPAAAAPSGGDQSTSSKANALSDLLGWWCADGEAIAIQAATAPEDAGPSPEDAGPSPEDAGPSPLLLDTAEWIVQARLDLLLADSQMLDSTQLELLAVMPVNQAMWRTLVGGCRRTLAQQALKRHEEILRYLLQIERRACELQWQPDGRQRFRELLLSCLAPAATAMYQQEGSFRTEEPSADALVRLRGKPEIWMDFVQCFLRLQPEMLAVMEADSTTHRDGAAHRSTAATTAAHHALGRAWAAVEEIGSRFATCFALTGQALANAACTLSMLDKLQGMHDLLAPVWMELGRGWALDRTGSLHSVDGPQLVELLQRLEEVLSDLFPASSLAQAVRHASMNKEDVSLASLEHLLHTELLGLETLPDADASSELPQAPLPLIYAMPWFRKLSDSQLFQFIWRQAAGPKLSPSPSSTAEPEDGQSPTDEQQAMVTHIQRAAREWNTLARQLRDGSLTVAQLRPVFELLLQEGEVDLLVYMAPPSVVGNEEGGSEPLSDGARRQALVRSHSIAPEADDLPPDELPAHVANAAEWVAATRAKLQAWTHLQVVLGSVWSGQLADTLQAVEMLVQDEALAAVQSLAETVAQLAAQAPQNRFAELTLAACEPLLPLAARLSEQLLAVDREYVELLQANAELFDWLQNMPLDGDFSAAIDIASNKSELECPPELWQKGEGGLGGRPNESILSSLANVRSVLYSFIYRTESKFARLPMCLEAISGTAAKSVDVPQLKKQLAMCRDLRQPLMDILDVEGTSASGSVIDKLLNLQDPSRQATWVVSSAAYQPPPAADGSEPPEPPEHDSHFGPQEDSARIWLQLAGEGSSQVVLRLPELLDFQTVVTLSNDRMSAEKVKDAVMLFNVQLGLIQAVEHTLTQLRSSGHFEFQTYSLHSTMQVSKDQLQKWLAYYKTSLRLWVDFVQHQRSTHRFVNYFTLQQIYSLCRELELHSDAKPSDPPDSFIQLTHFVARQPLALHEAQVLWHRLLAEWRASRGSSDSSDSSSTETTLGFSHQAQLDSDPPAWAEELAGAAPASDVDGGPAHAADSSLSTAADMSSASTAMGLLARVAASLDRAWATMITPAERHVALDAGAQLTGTLPPSGVSVITTSSPAALVDQGISAFARMGLLPEADTLLVCTTSTTLEEVENLIYRWSYAPDGQAPASGAEEQTPLPDGASSEHASSSPLPKKTTTATSTRGAAPLYCLFGIDSLSFEIQRSATLLIHRRLHLTKVSLLVLSYGESFHMVNQFPHCRFSPMPLSEAELAFVGQQLSRQFSAGVTTYTSMRAGAGKTFRIMSAAAAQANTELLTVAIHDHNLLGSLQRSVGSRLAEIAAASKARKKDDPRPARVFLHLDLSETTPFELDRHLLALVFARVLFDGRTSAVFFLPREMELAIEVASGPLVQRLRTVQIVPCTAVTISRDTFVSAPGPLEAGMGAAFWSQRNNGLAFAAPASHTAPSGGEAAAKSSAADKKMAAKSSAADKMAAKKRLVKQGRVDGSGPASAASAASPSSEPEGHCSTADRITYVCHVLALLETCTSNNTEFPVTLPAPVRLPAPEQYDLLVRFVTDNNPSMLCSFRTLHAFVNVLYWQLRELHAPGSALNALSVLPQPSTRFHFREDEAGNMEKMRGTKARVLQFLINTARDFATRQLSAVKAADVVKAEITGFTNTVLNGTYRRLGFDYEEKPCFRKGELLLYYRGWERCWVIDNVFRMFRLSYAKCMGADISGAWTSSPGWQANPAISVTNVRARNAYRGEAVQVEGSAPSRANASSTASENGVYLRRPPYDDINGHPHYVQDQHYHSIPKHIFFNSLEQAWVISIMCNDEGAALAMSLPNLLFGPWRTLPKGQQDEAVTVRLVTYGEELKQLNLKSPDEIGELEQVRRNNDQDVLKAELEMATTLMNSLSRWSDSTHDCLLFDNARGSIRFLTLDPRAMRVKMYSGLLQYLAQNHVLVGVPLSVLANEAPQLLSTLTGVERSEASATKLLTETGYCLNGDNLIKIAAIMFRLRCGLPVVLMGECGAGKTALIVFLCRWVRAKLFVLDVHGGTTEADIVGIIEKAEHCDSRQVFVFLDEVNTCRHMGLLKELICDRRIYGRPISDRIHILAALNPYRQRVLGAEESEGGAGLALRSLAAESGGTEAEDPMDSLVYKVQPVPHSLLDLIFDFGALPEAMELDYIGRMVAKDMPGLHSAEKTVVGKFIAASQRFIRQVEGDTSATSLRDVKRCLKLTLWFRAYLSGNQQGKISPMAVSVVLGLALVYFYRLPSAAKRAEYWDLLRAQMEAPLPKGGFDRLRRRGTCELILKSVSTKFVENMDFIDQDVALNEALTENVFVTAICILNRISVFMVGAPGSSKSLTLQLLASNLQGPQSSRKFWAKFPRLHIVQYQCSHLSTSASLLQQFHMAKNYQAQGKDSIVVLLLDEVGLAELSPDMPLKALHYMLLDSTVSIVGLSNMKLDPAKLNRAVLLQRPHPSPGDIRLTGERIFADQDAVFLDKLAKAYHEVYTSQGGRDFIGMRDFYSLIKLLRHTVAKIQPDDRLAAAAEASASPAEKENVVEKDTTTPAAEAPARKLEPNVLSWAVCRNFGGKPELLARALETFHTHCFGGGGEEAAAPHTGAKPDTLVGFEAPPVEQLIGANLADDRARHLMLLTENNAALGLLRDRGLFGSRDVVTLIGSRFADDQSDLYLIGQLNRVKIAMSRGSTVVLVNHQGIYESLYDVLNQRFVTKTNAKTGQVTRMLRLAIGPRSQLCQVEEGFKLVVIEEQQAAYQSLDLALLSRFEKQVLGPRDVLSAEDLAVVDRLQAWVSSVTDDVGSASPRSVFCGFHPGCLAGAVFMERSLLASTSPSELLCRVQRRLLRVAMPEAMLASENLRQLQDRNEYFAQHADLKTVLDVFVLPETEQLHVISTLSPTAHLDECQAALPPGSEILHLAELSSELGLQVLVDHFFTSVLKGRKEGVVGAAPILVVQCDPFITEPSIIKHAQYLCEQALANCRQTAAEAGCAQLAAAINIVFVVHMPPGLRRQERFLPLDFSLGWTTTHLDDVRPPAMSDRGVHFNLPVIDMLRTPTAAIVCSYPDATRACILQSFQSALSSCRTLPLDAKSSAARVGTLSSGSAEVAPAAAASTASSKDDGVAMVDYATPARFTYADRISMLQNIFQNPRFYEVVLAGVVGILEHHGDVDGNPVHVAATLSEPVTGSLRQSLQMGVHRLVLRALATVLSTLDTNFNLCLVQTMPEPWFKLASLAVDWKHMAANSKLVTKQPNMTVINTGKHGPLFARFPFSSCFIRPMEQPSVAERAAAVLKEAADPGVQRQRMLTYAREMLTNFMGSQLVAMADEFCQGQGAAGNLAYVHDFVASTEDALTDLTFAEHLGVVRKCLAAACPAGEGLQSVAGMYAALWLCGSRRLSSFLSLLSGHSTLPAAVRQRMWRSLMASSPERGLGSLDTALLDPLFAHFQAEFGRLKHAAGAKGWLAQLSNVSTDVESLLLLLEEESQVWISRWQGIHTGLAAVVGNILVPVLSQQPDAVLDERGEGGAAGAAAEEPPRRQKQGKRMAAADKRGGEAAAEDREQAAARKRRGARTRRLQEIRQAWYTASAASLPQLAAGLVDAASSRSSLPFLRDLFKQVQSMLMEGKQFLTDGLRTRNEGFMATFVTTIVRCFVFEQAAAAGPLDLAVLGSLADIAELRGSGGLELPPSLAANAQLRRALSLELMAHGHPPVGTLAGAVLVLDLLEDRVQEAMDQESAEGGKSKGGRKEEQGVVAAQGGADKKKGEKKDADTPDLPPLCLAAFGEEDVELIARGQALELLTGKKMSGEVQRAAVMAELDSLARARFNCKAVAERLVQLIEPMQLGLIKELEAQAAAVFRLLHEVDVAARYLFKYLASQRGLGVATPLFSLPPSTRSWLPPVADTRAFAQLRHADPLRLVCKPEAFYERVSNIVQTCILEDLGSLEPLQELLAQQKYWEAATSLLAAVFAEGVLNRPATVDEAGVASLHRFVRQWFTAQNATRETMSVVEWILGGCRLMVNRNWADGTSGRSLLQLMVFLALEALQSPSSWLGSLLFRPQMHATSYMPGMPITSMATIIGAAGHVGFYTCRRGHLYTVGNCTYPMEETRCSAPGCGEVIGGRNHTPARGNKRVNAEEMLSKMALNDSQPIGYVDKICGDLSELSLTQRTSAMSALLLRVTTHLMLLLSIALSPTGTGMQVAQGLMKLGDAKAASVKLCQHLGVEFRLLCRSLGMAQDRALVACHVLMRNHPGLDVSPRFSVPKERDEFEGKFDVACLKRAAGGLEADVRAFQERMSDASRLEAIKVALGPRLWEQLLEVDQLPPGSAAEAQGMLWRLRALVSFRHFRETFHGGGVKSEQEFPLLHKFLELEARLPKIKLLVDIVQWIAILQRVLPSRSLTREEARELTNAEVLERLPEGPEREHGREVLERYCAAFNDSFRLVHLIFECQPNPFLTASGEVDFGGGSQMCASTPVAFSLPSMVQGAVDAPGMCTIQLITTLQDAHNQLWGELQELNRYTVLEGGGEEGGGMGVGEGEEEGDGEGGEERVPTMTFRTAPDLIRRRLILYERERDLMRLVRAFARQSVAYGSSNSLAYGFAEVEQALASSLLAGTGPVAIQITQFEYLGETRQRGHLLSLRSRVPQEPLPPAVLELLWKELDTAEHAAALMQILEDSIAFLGDMGGMAAEGSGMLLADYVCKTLLVEERRWQAASTPLIRRSVRLCHLQSLFVAVEERINGSPLDNVVMAYREDLTPDLQSRLAKVHAHAQVLVPILRDLLVGQLCEAQFPAEENLKEYLTYVSTSEEDLDDLPWYEELFPEELELRHAFATLQDLCNV